MIPKDPNKDKKIEEVLKKSATRFVLEEASNNALITITHVDVSPKAEHATVFFTAFPEAKEQDALAFLKRKRSDFKEFIRNETRIQRIPFIDFEIDFGEKNRQNIDRLSSEM